MCRICRNGMEVIRLKDFYIRKISLRNYRRFEEKTIYFNQNMNLLIGKNASGKTTVLEAVNVALGAYLAAYKEYVPSRFVQNISDSDVRRKNQRTDQKDVLLSSGIEQYPCSVETELLMDGHKFVYRRILEKRIVVRSLPRVIRCKRKSFGGNR